MVITKKQKIENWLEDKTHVYQHGWKECGKGNSHRQFMYPDQHDQDEYTIGYSEHFAVQECEGQEV
jgi:hypothetical protein